MLGLDGSGARMAKGTEQLAVAVILALLIGLERVTLVLCHTMVRILLSVPVTSCLFQRN